jgi:hypothetical protein
MWPFKGKPKRVLIRHYSSFTNKGTDKKHQRDANRMAEKGYRQTFVVNDSRGMFFRAGGRTVTYELIDRS